MAVVETAETEAAQVAGGEAMGDTVELMVVLAGVGAEAASVGGTPLRLR